MSGITGIIRFDDSPVEQDKIDRMLTVIKHRGRDGRKVWLAGAVAFGFNRNETGHVGDQPVVLSGGLVVMLDGVIYNRKTLTVELEKRGVLLKSRNDAEIAAHLYRINGKNFLRFINGMFALAIWDEEKKALFLARDRLGMKPLYYSLGERFFAFASEIKALLKIPDIHHGLNESALVEYCTFQNILSDTALFKGIKKVLPAHYIEVSQGKVKSERYWSPDFRKVDLGCEEEYTAKFLELLKKAVKRTFPSTSFGSYLSGGFDSPSVAALAATFSESPLKTFCGYYPEGSAYDESPLAEEVAGMIGSRHHRVPIKPDDYLQVIEQSVYHLEEPTSGSAAFAYYILYSQFSRHVRVVLTGHGGDELFGGYPAYKVAYFKDRLKKNPFHVYRLLKDIKGWEWPRILYFWLYPLIQPNVRYGLYTMFPEGQKKKLFKLEFLRAAYGQETLVNPRNLLLDEDMNLVDQIVFLYLSTYLPALVAIEDRMGMAHGVEARMPICDLEMLEFATTIPMKYKIKDGIYKYIEKEAMRPFLPEVLYHQPKRGFPTPFARWYRGPLKSFTRDVLLEKKYLPEEIFDYKYIQSFLESFWRGRVEGLRDYEKATKIYSLISIAFWFKIFT